MLKLPAFASADWLAFLGLTMLGLAFAPSRAHAYPEFIGYGYTSCVTCHYNTQGNGPLNDYGRALFAGEISARDAFDETTTDDQLGAASGFLGKKELPWWLRPGFKMRGLWLNPSPGFASDHNAWSYYLMQEDVNMTFLFDKEQKYVLQLNVGRYASGNGSGFGHGDEIWMSREHYLRVNVMKSLWISVGMLEKVYGLRIIDHTAVNRAGLGIVDYEHIRGSLTHGVVLQYNQTEWELTGHYFIGNMNENTEAEQKAQQKGFSLMYEKNVGEKSRAGISFLNSKNETTQLMRVGLTDKLGLSIGSALLAEFGYKKDTTDSTSSELSGFYAYLQSNVLLRRGYMLYNQAEYTKYSNKTGAGSTEQPDTFMWTTGFLMFPLPRTEVRFTARDTRAWNDLNGTSAGGPKDSWDLQTQLHISL